LEKMINSSTDNVNSTTNIVFVTNETTQQSISGNQDEMACFEGKALQESVPTTDVITDDLHDDQMNSAILDGLEESVHQIEFQLEHIVARITAYVESTNATPE